ncbi:MAG TPA: hypothetical protein VFK52_05515 [Nocardioidaceae bacterium]|nr:hypothetical protein [Nocardioidaceae bacterium]
MVQSLTLGPDDEVTASLAPYFLDTELAGTYRSGMRRDVEETATGVRITLTRWIECPSLLVTSHEKRYDDELADLMREIRVAVGQARLASMTRTSGA